MVLGSLGSGGMGAVYRALDTRLERQVAIKVLHRETAVSGPRERFMREARLVSSLNHPNICTVFDIGDEDGDPYLVMELLEGESLKERMIRGPVPAEDIREIAFRVGLALQAAHAKGIIHRDIKPANLFLVNDGRGSTDVKVLDFGLAKLESGERRVSVDGLTRAGATVGTVEYMSPEQACGEPLDARSDLFSFGAVLYEMATGVVPFHGATSAIIFSELLNRDPVPPREKNLGVPRDLDRLIRSLLVKDREGRVRSAGALLRALAEGSAEYEQRRVESLRRPATPQPRGEQPEAAGPASEQMGKPDSSVPTVALDSGERPALPAMPVANVLIRPKSALEPKAAREPRVSMPLPVSGAEAEALDPTPAFGKRARSPSGLAVEHPARSGERPATATSKAEVAERVSTGWKVALAAGIVVALLVTLLVLLLLARRPTATAALDGAVQVLPLVNQTGDSSLDRAPTVALELLLAESPRFAVRWIAAAETAGMAGATEERVRGPDGVPDAAAGRLALLSGTLSHTAVGYVLALQVTDAATHAAFAETEDSVQSLAELPVLLSRSVSRLRVSLGEPLESVEANAPTLGDEGSQVMAALASFGEGNARATMGDTGAALAAYRRAVEADGHFQLAEIRLARALQEVHASAAAEAALRVLQQQASTGGTGLRRARAFALAEAGLGGDAASLAEHWHVDRPRDVDGDLAAARARSAAGRGEEAVQVIAEAARLDPFRRDVQDAWAAAEIASGHADAAWQMQSRAYRLGVGSAGLSLAAAYLRGDAAGVEASRRNLASEPDSVPAALSEAAYLQNTGDTSGATAAFGRAEHLAAAHAETASATSAIRAQVEVSRALAGDCAAAVDAAPLLARAWCGLPALPAQGAGGLSSGGSGLEEAAARWQAGDLRAALDTAESEPRGEVLATLVRARLHELLGEPDAAIAEYRAITMERGADYLSGTLSYPVALAGLTEVYASMGDEADGARSAASLREVWGNGQATAVLLQSMARR